MRNVGSWQSWHVLLDGMVDVDPSKARADRGGTLVGVDQLSVMVRGEIVRLDFFPFGVGVVSASSKAPAKSCLGVAVWCPGTAEEACF
jgi:hypothetical protein